jgi:hypothetical protein
MGAGSQVCDHRLLRLAQCRRAPLALEQALIVVHHQRLRLGIGHIPHGCKLRQRRCKHQRAAKPANLFALLHLPSPVSQTESTTSSARLEDELEHWEMQLEAERSALVRSILGNEFSQH